jgi:tricarballylate dehydrogenase
MSKVPQVLVIGGGNAALTAALTAREAGARVTLVEASPLAWRGGNTQHTRNLRCMHEAPQDVLTDRYSEEEYWHDLLGVTKGQTDELLARLTIRASAHCRAWMVKHGVRFQPSLSGTLHLSRTNAFFMGGGKALVNAYYRSAQAMGVDVCYDTPIASIVIDNERFVAAIAEDGRRFEADACVLACGGFESNREWLREAWGQNEAGEWPAERFLIRGTRYNQGAVLRAMMQAGADTIGDPSQSHCVAIDARAPLYDGGICTRVDAVSLGIMVNREGKRFYDEGEDFWPKRYAIWGRLVAQQPGQIGYCIIDRKARGRFMPPVFPGVSGQTLPELATALGMGPQLIATVQQFNAACRVGTFNHTLLDDCHTVDLTPAKSHWALPLDEPPFTAYALRPGVTFTYLGLKTDANAAVHFAGYPSENLFVAGELMAGNILGQGYTAGIGMTIGTVFGRIAGDRAAKAALNGASHATP